MSEPGLKRQMLSGVFYTAMARYSGILISLVVMGVLARLLTPDDFGIVAIATVFINFFQIFTNIGISAAIVQYKELTDRQVNEIYMFTLWMGLGLSLLFCAASWPIAAYYSDSRLLPIMQSLSIGLFFAAAGIVPNALFSRDKRFRFMAWRTLAIQLISGVVAIAAALCGAGLYTLIIQQLLSGALLYFISLRAYPMRWLWCSGLQSIRHIWGYSLYQFLFNTVIYFTRNLDKMLIGRYIGMAPLGYYEKSYRLMLLPLQNLTHVLTPVLHPLLSDYQKSSQRLGEINERMVHILALVGLPLSLYLYFCSRELVLLCFGPQWEASVPAFEILALSCGVQIITSSSGSFFQSHNDTRGMFLCGLFTALISCGGYAVCLLVCPTIEGFAWSMLVACLLSFFQCYWQLYRHSFHRPLQLLLRQLVSPLVLTLLTGIVLFPLTLWTAAWPLLASLAVKSITCLLTTLVFVYLSGEWRILKEIRSYKK